MDMMNMRFIFFFWVRPMMFRFDLLVLTWRNATGSPVKNSQCYLCHNHNKGSLDFKTERVSKSFNGPWAPHCFTFGEKKKNWRFWQDVNVCLNIKKTIYYILIFDKLLLTDSLRIRPKPSLASTMWMSSFLEGSWWSWQWWSMILNSLIRAIYWGSRLFRLCNSRFDDDSKCQ